MIFPAETAFPTPPEPATTEIVRLTPADAPAMVALTDIAFPGFFRPRTYEMGAYYGIWDPDPSPGTSLLIAMAGERLCLNPFRELSGVCTHPGHRGHGLAARLMTQLLRDHRAANQTSWLHVVSTNTRAIELYRRMGFRTLREVHLHGLTRTL